MYSEGTLSLVRALKGAPLSCIVAMKLAAQPVGHQWLVAVTGYASQAVSIALHLLRELQLAIETCRFNGWMLTEKAQQLVLPANFTIPSDDNHHSSSSSSGGLYIHDQDIKQLPQQRASDDYHHSTTYTDALEELMRLGVPRPRAVDAIESAREQGEAEEQTLERIWHGEAYCASEAAKGLNNKPFYIAARIGDGSTFPAPSKDKTRNLDIHYHIQRKRAELKRKHKPAAHDEDSEVDDE